MPAEHELTDDELKEFAQHGVIVSPALPAASANEPENNTPVVQEPAPVQDPVAQQPRDPNTGQFAAKTEGATAPADPNAPPVDPNAQPAPAAPPPGFVPHQALHQERQQRQQLAQQMAMLQARTNAILAQQRPNIPELPDLDEDPVGYVQGLEQRLRAFEEERQIETRNAQIDRAMEQDESTFRVLVPDYDDASAHYVQSRAQELLTMYTPQQAQQIMLNEARQLAAEAWQRGVPAAQMVYQLAHARGYRAGAAPVPQPVVPTPAQPTPAPTGFQSAPAPSTPAQNAPSAAAVVAAAQQGQQATRTLSGGSGAATATDLNAEALLAMSDEEFEAYLKLGQRGANARFAAIG